MAPAPQSGTFVFTGRSGKSYFVDSYFSDVAGANVRFESGAGSSATSNPYWLCPEDVTLTDVSIVTGLTDTTRFRLVVNGKPLGDMLRYVLHVTTSPLRPVIRIGFKGGSQFTGIQLA